MSDAIVCRFCAEPPVGACQRCGHRMCPDHVPRYVTFACAECEREWRRSRSRLPLLIVVSVMATTLTIVLVLVSGLVIDVEARTLHSGTALVFGLVLGPPIVGVLAAATFEQRVLRPRFLRPVDPRSLPPARLLRRA